jgi:hypothetical protein
MNIQEIHYFDNFVGWSTNMAAIKKVLVTNNHVHMVQWQDFWRNLGVQQCKLYLLLLLSKKQTQNPETTKQTLQTQCPTLSVNSAKQICIIHPSSQSNIFWGNHQLDNPFTS